MKASRIYFFGIVLVIILILVYTFADTGVNDAYEREISQFRADKHEYFKSSADSPIKNKAQFSQLDYFPPDQHYRIMAALQPITDTARLQVRTTDGKQTLLTRFAYATFALEGREHRLLLLKSADEENNRLFLPFTDATNGFDTYGGGRYLDLAYKPGDKQLMIDFNLAYNPFCAYNDDYSCPIPPKENALDIAIKAGEKNYAKK
jgi:uncharacterized protein (DUF1684 family)